MRTETSPAALGAMDAETFELYLDNRLKQFPPDEHDAATMQKLTAKMAQLFEQCRAAHNLTEDTIDFLDEYASTDAPKDYYAKLYNFR
jgi:hypothetical protein